MTTDYICCVFRQKDRVWTGDSSSAGTDTASKSAAQQFTATLQEFKLIWFMNALLTAKRI